MRVRVLADADLNHVRDRGYRPGTGDRLHDCNRGNLEGKSDPAVLESAADQGRIVVSHDTSTMSVHFSERLRLGGASPGVFLVRQRASLGQVVEALLLVCSASAAQEWADQIHYLPSLARCVFRR